MSNTLWIQSNGLVYFLAIFVLMMCMMTGVSADQGQIQMTPQQMQQTVDRVLTLESRKKNTREVIQWFESLDEQGRWADIDYKHNQRAQWDPMNHASRLAHMALMWHDLNPDDAQRDTLGQAVIRGLDRWLEMKLESPNWWHNQIGVPKLLAIAALSMGGSSGDALDSVIFMRVWRFSSAA